MQPLQSSETPLPAGAPQPKKVVVVVCIVGGLLLLARFWSTSLAAAIGGALAVAVFVYRKWCGEAPQKWHEGAEWEQLFRQYDRLFELDWPTDTHSMKIPTSYGQTWVNLAGPPSGPPVILIPGTGASSAMWGGLATVLRTHRVIAVDVIGDVGRSELERMPSNAAEVVQWVREVVQGLGLQRVDIVGLSYGCWIASQVASQAPELVGKLALLAPAGVFASMTCGFVAHVVPAVLWPSEAMVSWAVRYQVGSEASIRQEVMRFVVASFRVPRLSFGALPPPSALPDEVLQRIVAPTLLLVGEMEKVTCGAKAMERAHLLVPNCEVEEVAGAGHMLTDEKPDTVHSRVAAFLAK